MSLLGFSQFLLDLAFGAREGRVVLRHTAKLILELLDLVVSLVGLALVNDVKLLRIAIVLLIISGFTLTYGARGCTKQSLKLLEACICCALTTSAYQSGCLGRRSAVIGRKFRSSFTLLSGELSLKTLLFSLLLLKLLL